MTTLAALRIATLLTWLALTVYCSGSAWRAFRHRPQPPGDDFWTLAWFFGLLQLGFGARWLLGLTAAPAGVGLTASYGLFLLAIGIGLSAIRMRHRYEGWRL